MNGGGPVDLSGLHMASPKFPKIVWNVTAISGLLLFFGQKFSRSAVSGLKLPLTREINLNPEARARGLCRVAGQARPKKRAVIVVIGVPSEFATEIFNKNKYKITYNLEIQT